MSSLSKILAITLAFYPIWLPADSSISIGQNQWLGTSSTNWETSSNWALGNTFSLPNPSYDTYVGPIEEFINGIATGNFNFPQQKAEISSSFTTDYFRLAAYDGISTIQLNSGSLLDTTASIGALPINGYVATNPIQPTRVIFNGGSIAGSWTFHEFSHVEIWSDFTQDVSVWNGSLGGLSVAANADFTFTNFRVGGDISNEGRIVFTNDTLSTSNEYLYLNNAVTVSGTGAIVLNSADAYISQYIGSGGLTNAAGHTIRGNGTIDAALHNQGLVQADGGTLNVAGGTSTGGRYEATSTGTVRFTGTTSGGTLSGLPADPGGQVDAFNGYAGLQDGFIENEIKILNDFGVYGTITNSGTLTFANSSGTNDENLYINNAVTFTGGGEIVLNSADAFISQYSGTGGLTNAAGHTIRGNGTIDAALHNLGLVRAEDGVLSVAGGNSTGGRYEATSTGTVRFIGTTSGGTLSGLPADPGGQVDAFNGYAGLQDGFIENEIAIANNFGVYGTITNSGTLTFANSSGTNDEDLYINDAVTFTGGGEIVLNSADAFISQYSGTGGLTNSSGHTIRGNGTIDAALHNLGLVRAEDGVLSVAGGTSTGGRYEATSTGTMRFTGTTTGGILSGLPADPGGQVDAFNGYAGLQDGFIEDEIAIANNFGVYGTITNTGILTFANSSGTTDEDLYINDAVTFTGNGAIVLNSTDAFISQYSGTGGLTNAAGHTIRGNGTIDAALHNQGLVQADGGTLNVAGGTSTGGRYEATSTGTVRFIGSLPATGGTLSGIPGDTGGQVDASSGYGGLQDGFIENEIAIANNFGVYGTITNTGILTFANSSGTTDEDLYINDAVTFTGNGAIVLNSSDAYINLYSGFGELTNAAEHTIRGNGTISATLHNQGLVQADGGVLNVAGGTSTGGRYEATSTGTLRFTGAAIGGTLSGIPGDPGGQVGAASGYGGLQDGFIEDAIAIVDNFGVYGTITNTGILTFANSSGTTDEDLYINDAVTFTGNGEIVLNSVDAYISQYSGTGGLTNAAGHTIRGNGTINAALHNLGLVQADGGVLSVAGGTSTGGRYEATSTGTLRFTGAAIGGTLSGIPGDPGGQVGAASGYGGLQDGFIEDAIAIVDNLGVYGTITNTGILTFANSSGTTDEDLYINDAVTFTGNGEILLNSMDAFISQYSGSGGLTNAAGHTIRGTGTISTSLINAGIIAPGFGGGSLHLSSLTQTETGLLQIEVGSDTGASANKLTINGTFDRDGELSIKMKAGANILSGDVFEIASASSLQGSFSDILLPKNSSGDPLFSISDNGNAIELTALENVNVPGLSFSDWATSEELDPASPYADNNANGYSDILDYAFAGKAQSVLEIAPVDTEIVLQFETPAYVSGVSISTETTTDLQSLNWVRGPAPVIVQSTPESTYYEVRITNPTESQFFRLKVLLD